MLVLAHPPVPELEVLVKLVVDLNGVPAHVNLLQPGDFAGEDHRGIRATGRELDLRPSPIPAVARNLLAVEEAQLRLIHDLGQPRDVSGTQAHRLGEPGLTEVEKA
jgi:hypothetical protein